MTQQDPPTLLNVKKCSHPKTRNFDLGFLENTFNHPTIPEITEQKLEPQATATTMQGKTDVRGGFASDLVTLLSLATSFPNKKRKKNLRAKRVTFASRVIEHKTITIADITEEEKQAAWFSREESDQITRSCCEQIRKLERRGQKNHSRSSSRSNKTCFRGLESHTTVRALAKRMNRSTATQAVLEEQERQAMFLILDEEAIRNAYCDASSSAQLWAKTVGLQDQREAEDIMDEEDDHNDRSSSLSSIMMMITLMIEDSHTISAAKVSNLKSAIKKCGGPAVDTALSPTHELVNEIANAA